MSFIVANSGENISAKFDGALRMTYANDQDYIVENIGSEFAMTYNSSSLQVSVGTGVANICGRGIMAEESNSITLTANTTTYLCLRIDLTQTQGQEGRLYANTTSTIATDNLNNVNGQHDMLLAVITTDGTGVSSLVDRRNIRSKSSTAYTLPTASASTLGGIKVGSRLSISNGVLSADSQTYSLPIATTTTLGGIKVGNNLAINNGVLSGTYSYSLPTASSSTLGGVKVGSNLSISNGVLSGAYSTASTSANGLMSASDKSKLNGIANGATANTGTVTSVSVSMNGSTKGTITTSGTIDLGSVFPKENFSSLLGTYVFGVETEHSFTMAGDGFLFIPAKQLRYFYVNGVEVHDLFSDNKFCLQVKYGDALVVKSKYGGTMYLYGVRY